MSISVQARPGKTATSYQLTVKHRTLPSGVFTFTFPDEEAARTYGRDLHEMLDRGEIPKELREQQVKKPSKHLTQLITLYVDEKTNVTDTDIALARQTMDLVHGLLVADISGVMADDLVRKMKADKHKPGTIRKKIDFLGRVLHHYRTRHDRRGIENVFRDMEASYDRYNPNEVKKLQEAGDDVPVDQIRLRRLTDAEETRLRKILEGEKAADRERPIEHDPEISMLYELYKHMGLRSREAYRLKKSSIRRTDEGIAYLFVEGTKGHRNKERPRDVPIVPAIEKLLADYVETLPEGKDRLFPGVWDGSYDKKRLNNTTARLSGKFHSRFAAAKIEDFVLRDLRHEAAYRFTELRDCSGQYLLSAKDLQLTMGWESMAMADRYLAMVRGNVMIAKFKDIRRAA